MAVPTPLHDICDADLVRQAMDGHREAFAEIYRRYHTVVYRFARMMNASSTIAEDITQETFTTLLRDLRGYAPDRAGLSTYLYGVARNVTRSRLRCDRRFVRFEATDEDQPMPAGDPCAIFEQSQRSRWLRQGIAQLPSRYREVIILCILHERSYAEVALILGTPVGTVRSRLSRARHALADRLRELERNAEVIPARTAKCAI